MPTLLLIALAIAVSPPVASATAAGPRTGATPSIVGGTTAPNGAYPAQAEVDIHGGGSDYLCGGTLVAPQWVLTAGHCVTAESGGSIYAASSFVVRLGSNLLGQGTGYAVDTVRREPVYDPSTLRYDAALLHLAAAAPQPPMPILDPSAAAFAATGALGRVVGWGATAEGGTVSAALQQVDVPIVADTACGSAYGRSYDTATMLCAGYPQGGRDACQGDSGGPLLVDTDPSPGVVWKLGAIVSGGEGCAEPGRYGLYTRLANAATRDWVVTTTGTAAPTSEPAPQVTATPVPEPVLTPVPVGSPPPRARVSLARGCTAGACRFTVTFAAGGSLRARVTVSRAVARRLGLSHRTIVSRARAYDAARMARVTLPIPARVHRALARHGLASVRARLEVTAVTADGRRTDARRSVRLRRR